MTTTVLHATGVTKSFGRKSVLNDLEFELAPGQVTVLLGANAAGKSTFMRLALGTLRINGGELRVLGRDPLKEQAAILRRVGYVPSVPDVYDWMRPRELFGFLAPQYPRWDRALCDELSDRLGVPHDTRFGAMSRGQGMKTMLVAALAPRPKLLLLDEPFAGLDPLVRDEVLHGVIAALREEGQTVLCSTHDLEIASRLAERVAILAGGRITRHGSIDEILDGQLPWPAGLKQAMGEDCRVDDYRVEEEVCP